MKVLLFGRLADRVGRQVDIEVAGSGCSVAELRELLAEHHPALADGIRSRRVRACVGDCIVSEEHRLDGHAAVEFFPPVSGG